MDHERPMKMENDLVKLDSSGIDFAAGRDVDAARAVLSPEC
jgi:hypothetical protein